ncbi:MAG: hypothetical protein AUJ32_00995 [Parcubacteria group bacterium CG1_02_40_82]|uniref:GxxExxY protein n=4 Tax=Candidatus Portnoyibacteriota TaxID=1817913 RepID=A0A2M7IIJ0_9BACT|nr:MAG: hypothetical protein AUJ32_00995 [Parcubacteria group bacterium CG1_02_40_82]PIQ75371.1 MAG: GxxExxY protein [Candidatus Portnoybacteria bacterium CG11_big_fil_rev_8_21_14_0_20_40_15]PIS30293.1 MAG: GxxExxY protein [Candidatus Portnoybacteria bacterium CG08_land_8_20_14_0_20_40_83]PIW76312.1 MAG: GxxExxY protein [Candidatus Portnoybacteria bacterium CG_4_8_14_3_um_filter_40_10]PIY75256.1 MAG: GxxExxY protein [Candidatus Portnoybacteria bacterium CG_4_10_14_0_8_um_filter_40_50]PJA64874.
MATNDTNKKSKIIYPELSYKLCGLFYKIHNQLGRFCREKNYSDALERELNQERIAYSKETNAYISYKNGDIYAGRYDFLIDDKILIELKARPYITKEDYYQLLRYLKAKNIKLGLLVNFRNKYLKPKRIAN